MRNGKWSRILPVFVALTALAWCGQFVLAAAPEDQSPADEGKKIEKKIIIVGDDDEDMKVIQEFGGKRGFLGVGLLELTPELQAHFGLAEGTGVLVSKVEADSPAAAAGVRAGDIITSVDGQTADSAWTVRKLVGAKKDGESVALEVQRNGAPISLSATVVERERAALDFGPLMGPGIKSRVIHIPDHPGEFEFEWQKMGDDEAAKELMLKYKQELGAEEMKEGARWVEGDGDFIYLDSAHLDDCLEKLKQHMESPEWQEKMRSYQDREKEMEKRLQELETRLQKLEQGL